MEKKSPEERTINGTVLADIWDDEDNIVGVAIETADGVEYLVEANETSNGLLECIDDLVEATGLVKERFGGDMIIRVDSYKVIGPYDKESGDDDEYDDEYYLD
jgi:hypothetical protein